MYLIYQLVVAVGEAVAAKIQYHRGGAEEERLLVPRSLRMQSGVHPHVAQHSFMTEWYVLAVGRHDLVSHSEHFAMKVATCPRLDLLKKYSFYAPS